MKKKHLITRSFLLSILISPFAMAQNATSNEWTGTDSDDWNTPLNWSLNTIPGAGDNAGISLGTPAVSTSAPGPSELTQLLIDGNTLDLNHSLGLVGTPFMAGAPATQATGGVYLGNGGSVNAATLNVNDGGTLTILDGIFRIGRPNNSANLNLSEGGEIVITTREFDIGRDNLAMGVFTQTGGDFSHNGSGDFKVGAFGGTGTYNLSGGTATVQNLRIAFAQNIMGDLGKGTLNQSGGTLNAVGGFNIGWANRGDSEYNMSGGLLNVDGPIRMGVQTNAESTPEHTTTNTFTQTGGSIFTTRLDVGEKPVHKNSYTISSGTLETSGALRIGTLTPGASGEVTISGDAEVTTRNLVLGIVDDTVGILNLNGGILNVDQILAGQTNTVAQVLNLNGGTIKARINTGNLMHGGFALTPILHENGITIDTNGFATSVGSISGAGPITKAGDGNLSFRLPSTFVGDIIINEGDVSVAIPGGLNFKPEASGISNKVTGNGSGSFSFAGKMTIDLTDSAAEGTWVLIDSANLASNTFGTEFEITGWADQGDDTWTLTSGGADYTFDEATGQLSAGEGASPFSLWAGANGLTAENNGENDDPDSDGLANILEFALATSPLAHNGEAFTTNTLSSTELNLSFLRNDDSESSLSLVVEYGSDLQGWTAIPVGDASSAKITVEENDGDSDTISLTIDRNLATDGKLFVRIKATPNP